MNRHEKTKDLLDTRCFANVLEEIECTFKGWMKEVVEDVISDKMCNVNLEDKTMSVPEVCERWKISKSTLKNREGRGIIKPIPLDGRKKVYAYSDVLAAEANGFIKHFAL